MNRKMLAAVGGAALAFGTVSPAFAQGDRFDYFEFQGTRTGELEGQNDTVDIEEGVSLDAAKSVNDVVFIRGTFDSYNTDAQAIQGIAGEPGSGQESGIDILSIGPGVGLPLGWAHVYGQVTYERLDIGGTVGNGPGAEIGATIGPEDGLRVGVSARRGEPNFGGGMDDFEYELYSVDGRMRVAEDTDIVLGYQEGMFEADDGDETDLKEVVSLGLRFGF